MSTYFENNEFLNYLYGEQTKKQAIDFQTEIIIDSNKYDEIAEYEGLLHSMDKIEFTPSKKAIDNVLDFARKASLQA